MELSDQIQSLPSGLHPVVENIVKHDPVRRSELNAMWNSFHKAGLDEPNFVQNLAAQPTAFYWELLIGCMLLDAGYPVTRPALGPDFRVETSDGVLWIEATSVGPGELGKGDTIPYSSAGWRPDELIAMRITYALYDKLMCKNTARHKIMQPHDFWVLALNTIDLGHATSSLDVAKALFGGGNYVYQMTERQEGDLELTDEYNSRQLEMSKSSGSRVSKAGFLDGTWSDVSAVLHGHFNINWPIERARERLTSFRNPRAGLILPRDWLRIGTEIDVHTDDERLTLETDHKQHK